MIFSLTFCGHTELAPAATTQSSLYQLPDFEMPVPENRGSTVRNLQAFQVGFDAFNSCILNVKGWVLKDSISGFTVSIPEVHLLRVGRHHS